MTKAINVLMCLVMSLGYGIEAFTQVDTLFVCEQGETITLQAPPGFYAYRWFPDIGLDNPTVAAPVATVFQPTTFITQYITEVNGDNLIVNPGFEEGNNGFQSEYIFTDNIFTQGLYGINKSAFDLNPTYFTNCPGHSDGTGDMMVVDGYPEPDIKVWCQTIDVRPSTQYAFSVWLASVRADNPAELQFFINDQTIGATFRAGHNVCTWRQFYEVWASEDATSAEICIINQNTDPNGNDFALDDFAFVELQDLLYDTTVVIIEAIEAAKERRVYFPNVFTPNFDGVNDVYRPSFGKGVQRLREFKIYNRWGGIVFSKSNCSVADTACGWDGTVTGSVANAGLYVYSAEVIFADQKSEIYAGEVNLIRQ